MHHVRSMENKDLLAYKRLCSICYSYPDTGMAEDLPEEQLRIRRGVYDEKGNLLSAMMQIPYEVRFCGQTVPMLGIGGVVTDPVARRGGAIRAIFEQDLPRQYREGQVFSALYPFSFRFYGKFGYTWMNAWKTCAIAPQDIRSDLQAADEIIRILPDEDDQGMKEIYAVFIAKENLAILRSEWMWKDLRRGTPWEAMKHAYVFKADGKSVAYWIGTVSKEGDGATLRISDMAWTCPRGRDAIFAMFRGMNELANVEMRVRGGFDLRSMASEAYDVSDKGCNTAMVRVINAERALALLPAPLLPGMLTIEVHDDQIAENCGRFVIGSDGEELTVTRNDAADADLKCNIQGLSALVIGRHAFAEAVGLGVAEVVNPGKARLAELLFAERKLSINWSF